MTRKRARPAADGTARDELRTWYGWAANLPTPTVSVTEIWDLLALAERAIEESRRDALDEAAKVVRTRLTYDDQRAVSWHEVQDCAEAVEALRGAD